MGFRYGALFDMDGVLIDNAEYHILAFEEWCREKGIAFDRELFTTKLFGKQNGDIFLALTGVEMSPEDVVSEGDYKEAIYRRIYADNVKLLDGIPGFLADLKAEGFGLAVATSGPPENAALVLEMGGITSVFDAIVTCRDTSRGKPDPEVFILAANRLGLSTDKCVVFEDSKAGAKAAQASGAALIGVTTGHRDLDHASMMIGDFREISAADVIELLADKCPDIQPTQERNT